MTTTATPTSPAGGLEALARRPCLPCRGGVSPVSPASLPELLATLGDGWQLVEGKKLRKEFRFPDFAAALAFVVRVGRMADEEDHHPEIHLTWGRATLEIWTHTIDGLADSDFVWAAKAELLAAD
jgi:4a-hydroxytetrahydrobiopterin dehydratase